jgi:hypothetical protein
VQRYRFKAMGPLASHCSDTQSYVAMANAQGETGSEVRVSQPTLRLYRRIHPGKKHLFASSDSSEASYFIVNPVPHKHAHQWRPIFYRGDNPKYTATSSVIGRARRGTMWSSFKLWLGDGVAQVVENEKRKKQKKKHRRKTKLRKMFGLKEKLPKEELKEEEEITGKIILVKLKRHAFGSRTVEFEVEGVKYKWTGTRTFSTGRVNCMRGWSHNLKVLS